MINLRLKTGQSIRKIIYNTTGIFATDTVFVQPRNCRCLYSASCVVRFAGFRHGPENVLKLRRLIGQVGFIWPTLLEQVQH